jgi:LacI family transcriptional regulator
MRDVAVEAGVSVSTASRAISGTGYVSPDARSRVLAAAERLGYVPNDIARSLRARSTRAVGVLISDLGNPFYAEVANGAESELRTRGLQMLLADSDGRPDEEVAALRMFEAMRIDGVVLAPAHPPSDSIARFARSGRIVVEVDRVSTLGQCDVVIVENERGAYQATRHLVELGHRRIGLLVGETSYTTGGGRLAGYRAALGDAQIDIDDSLIQYTSFHPQDAREVAAELLASAPGITALFATNQILAQGAIRAIWDAGLRIPRDISLVAFDDATWMAFASPGISTVAQPAAEIGSAAVSLLVDRLNGDLLGPPVVRQLPTRFIRRASTAPPRRDGSDA